MSIKICLDAGHFGKYNQSPVNKKYFESEMTWKLQGFLKKELEAFGIEVITTRKSQNVDLALEKRGKASKGCNLFLSLHSNASSNANADFAVACCQIDDNRTKIDEVSEAIGRKLAAIVNSTMGSKGNWTIWEREGNNNADYYGVLRGAKSVGVAGVLLEHGFHTNKANTEWLLKDANLKKLAKAEAKVIAEYFGVKKPATATTTTATNDLYRVRKSWKDTKSQIGAFSSLESAKKLADQNAGYSVFNSKGIIVHKSKALPSKKKTVTEIAREVIQGKWGNGTARKEALTKAGYDYSAVQKEVNRLLGL